MIPKHMWKSKIGLLEQILATKRYGTFFLAHPVLCMVNRVVRGDINFEILRDPLDFLFLIDPYGPYLIEFSLENGSFLLTKALFWVNFCPFRATGRKGRG